MILGYLMALPLPMWLLAPIAAICRRWRPPEEPHYNSGYAPEIEHWDSNPDNSYEISDSSGNPLNELKYKRIREKYDDTN